MLVNNLNHSAVRYRKRLEIVLKGTGKSLFLIFSDHSVDRWEERKMWTRQIHIKA